MHQFEQTPTNALTAEQKRALVRQLVQQSTRTTSETPGVVDTPPAYYRMDQYDGYKQLAAHAKIMASINVENPFFRPHESVSKNTLTIMGKEYINYSGYNYLGLSGDPDVSAAAKAAIDRYGTSVSASRIVSGEIPLHKSLENLLADMLGVEACAVFVSGYATNVSTIAHLFGPKDLIIHDNLIHNSLMTGCQLSGARRIPFPHNDWKAAEQFLAENRRDYQRALVIVEGVYSMDGDIPNLPEFIALKRRHKAFLMVDEAHSIGVLGKRGNGLAEHFGVPGTEVDIWMGTLSKAFASCGGYIAGSTALVENLKYNANGGILYSVGITPANAAAAAAAIRKMHDEPKRLEWLRSRSELFLQLAKSRGLDTGPSSGSPVVPIVLGNSILCLKLAQYLFEHGINVHPILYPAVPENAARLRFFITALHTDEEIRITVDAIRGGLSRLGEDSTPSQSMSR